MAKRRHRRRKGFAYTVAFHEAGHAMMHILVGLPFVYAKIGPKGRPDCGAFCQVDDPPLWLHRYYHSGGVLGPEQATRCIQRDKRRWAYVTRVVLTFVGGRAAEHLFMRGAGINYKDSAIGAPLPSDNQDFIMARSLMASDEVLKLEMVARRRLRDHWPQVMAIAGALITRRRLTWKAAKRLTRARRERWA